MNKKTVLIVLGVIVVGILLIVFAGQYLYFRSSSSGHQYFHQGDLFIVSGYAARAA